MDVATLRAYDVMFQSDGWKNLLQEVEDELALVKDILTFDAKDFTTVCYMRGRMYQLNTLLTLEESLIAMVQAEQASEEEEPDATL